jgi:hypothetical protein
MQKTMTLYSFENPDRAFWDKLRECLLDLEIDQNESGVKRKHLRRCDAVSEAGLAQTLQLLVEHITRDYESVRDECWPELQIFHKCDDSFPGNHRLSVMTRLRNPDGPGSISYGRYVSKAGKDWFVLWMWD